MYVCTYVLCVCMYVCHYSYLPYEAGLLTIIMSATNQFVVSSNRLAWSSSLPFLVYTNCKGGGKNRKR